jgi:hypothetical protein
MRNWNPVLSVVVVCVIIGALSGCALNRASRSPEQLPNNVAILGEHQVPGPEYVRLAFVSVRDGVEGFWARNISSPSRRLQNKGYVVDEEELWEGPVVAHLKTYYRVRARTSGEYMGYLTVDDAERFSKGEMVRYVPAQETRRAAEPPAPPRANGEPRQLPRVVFQVENH